MLHVSPTAIAAVDVSIAAIESFREELAAVDGALGLIVDALATIRRGEPPPERMAADISAACASMVGLPDAVKRIAVVKPAMDIVMRELARNG